MPSLHSGDDQKTALIDSPSLSPCLRFWPSQHTLGAATAPAEPSSLWK